MEQPVHACNVVTYLYNQGSEARESASGSNFEREDANLRLSNMMQDGEFLCTSCGSPNYASPEVGT